MSPAAPPLEDDNLLPEILLRLPPQPSSLPCASAVCKRWRSLASDPAFSRRFRRHHRRNPTLLGFFCRNGHGISFEPTLESPNRVPPERFSLKPDGHVRFLGCRHGLVLIIEKLTQFLVWDPFTGQQNRIAIPPGFDLTTKAMVNGTVLRSAAGDVPHFKVVLVAADRKGELNRRWLACVYSSETGVWGSLISTPNTSQDFIFVSKMPAVLVGGSLHWHIVTSPLGSILEFNVETESLSVIQMPPSDGVLGYIVMRAEGGGLGLLSRSGFTAQVWKRKTNSHGVSSWGMGKTIELGKLLSLNLDSDRYIAVLGFAEDNNSVYLLSAVSSFIVQLDSLQFKKCSMPKMPHCYQYHPFESVYAAGI